MDSEAAPPFHVWDEGKAYEELLSWDSLIQQGHRLLPHDFNRYTVLHMSTQYYRVLHSTTHKYRVLHSTTHKYTVLHSATQYYT